MAQADSLWQVGQMYGVDASDSATLAQAYETLKKHSAPSLVGRAGGEVFSHACYHYGRLLRTKDNPVEAMQAFIAATHSHTRDYHILGRVYSNMGDICHLAGDYPLSYDMFERSANSFLQGGDTTAYYYALNDMAFELAEQGKKEETLALLRKIEGSNQSNDFSEAVLITKILLAIRAKQYKDVIDLVDKICIPSAYNPTIMIAKAQAYYYLQSYDSAAHYAQEVLDKTKSPFDKDNAYYILIHCDSVQHGNRVYTLSADRADTEKEIEKRHGKLTQAVQLLEQDLNRKPDLTWLYVMIAIILFAGSISILFYIWHKRKQHYQIITDIQEKEAEIGALSQMQETQHKQIIEEVENKCTALRYAQDLKSQLHWRQYDEMCQIIDTQFFLLVSKLKQIPAIKENDVRICVLVLLNLSQRDIARLMYVEESSVGKLKERTGNKLHTSRKNMRQELLKIIIGDKK